MYWTLREACRVVGGTDVVAVLVVCVAQVRDMVGRNPIILIGTKMDLLPEGAHPKVRIQSIHNNACTAVCTCRDVCIS